MKQDWWAKQALMLQTQNDILKKIIANDKKDRLIRVFICSPLRGDIDNNIKKAKELCHEAVKMGYAPFAPHAFYTQFLDDGIEEERNTGIQSGISFLRACDEIWVYDKKGITEGMKLEIELAQKLGKEIKYNPWG